MEPVSYRQIKQGEETAAFDLVSAVFKEFVAPLFSEEGVNEFQKFIRIDALRDRLKAGNLMLLAETEHKVVGFVEIRDKNHIALLFVKKSFQNRGIAKGLLRRAIKICRNREPNIQKITVNSSPNAFPAYKKIGFKGVEVEKVVHEIRFIPMELILDKKGAANN